MKNGTQSLIKDAFQKPALVFAVLGFLLLLNLTGGVRWAVNHAGHGYLQQQNEAYLSECLKETTGTFLALSLMKSGLAVLQSSSAGISFVVDLDVQVGQFAQSFKEMVDLVWRALLVALGFITFLKLTLPLLPLLGEWALALLIVLGMAHGAAVRWRPDYKILTRRLAEVAGFLSLLFYLLIPLSVAGASLLAQNVTNHSLQNSRDRLENIQDELALGGKASDPKNQAHEVTRHWTHHAHTIRQKLEAFTRSSLEHLAVLFFNVLVFPLGLLALLYVLFSRGLQFLSAARPEKGEEGKE